MNENIDPTAIIHKGSKIHPSVEIGSYSIVYPGVTISENVIIGDHSIIGRKPIVGKTQARIECDSEETIIEPGVIIGSQVIVYAGATIGRESYLADKCFIREGVSLGNNVVIGTSVTVAFSASISSGTKVLTSSNIAGNSKIGAGSFIGAHVCMVNDNTPLQPRPRSEMSGATIGDQVVIGSNATILPEISIESDNFIGAGAILTKSVKGKDGLYLGVPARKR